MNEGEEASWERLPERTRSLPRERRASAAAGKLELGEEAVEDKEEDKEEDKTEHKNEEEEAERGRWHSDGIGDEVRGRESTREGK